MKIKILDKMVIKNKKVFLTILGAILIGGIAFSVIQIVIAAPPSPGHSWNQIGDFPSNCGTGQYVYGLGSTLLCGTPAGGGTSAWTLSGSNLYPNSTGYYVIIGQTSPYTGSKLSVNGGTGIAVDGRGSNSGGYFANTNGNAAHLGTGSYGVDAFGSTAGGYFKTGTGNSGYALLGYGNVGGYFRNYSSSGSSYCYVANSDNYGIYCVGTTGGAGFSDSDNGINTLLAQGTYGLWTNGTKSFVIDHPTKLGMKLVHSAIEGPENAVFYRGEDQLNNGKLEIYLPEYFEALVQKGNRTVLLTPKFEDENEAISQLAASSIENGKFIVRAIENNNPSQKFYWEVKAVRGDLPSLEVEQPATNFPAEIEK